MPESLVEVSLIFLVKKTVLFQTKMNQHTNATEHNTSRKNGVFRAVITKVESLLEDDT